jgi:polar amino acid transport system substrate-binding protein
MVNIVLKFLTAGAFAGFLLASQQALALKLLTEENPPLNYTENKQVTGMGTEVLLEMGKRAKVPMEIQVMEWGKAYEMAQDAKETCLYSTARLPNRENVFKWVGPIAANKWGLFALEGFKPEIKSLKDVRPYRVAGVARDAKTEFLKQQGVTNIVEEKDDKLNPTKLTLNRKETQKADLWVTSIATARKVAAEAKVPGIKLVHVVHSADSYLACSSRTNAATLKALTEALESMKKDGSFDKIIKRYEP